ncbi:unnamed protein product [Amaranthus hypochondriacus]
MIHQNICPFIQETHSTRPKTLPLPIRAQSPVSHGNILFTSHNKLDLKLQIWNKKTYSGELNPKKKTTLRSSFPYFRKSPFICRVVTLNHKVNGDSCHTLIKVLSFQFSPNYALALSVSPSHRSFLYSGSSDGCINLNWANILLEYNKIAIYGG